MNELDLIGRRPSGKHMIAGVCAAVVSLFIHVAGVVYMADMKFDSIYVRNKNAEPEEVDTIHLGDIIKESFGVSGDAGIKSQEEISRLLKSDIPGSVEMMQIKPDEVTMEPPALAENGADQDPSKVQAPESIPVREKWQPLREILMVQSKVVQDEVAGLERKMIPNVERVRDQVEMSWTIDPSKIDVTASAGTPGLDVLSVGGSRFSDKPSVQDVAGNGGSTIRIGEGDSEGGSNVVREKPEEVTEFKPIEDLLQARITLYSGLTDFKFGYFKIEIDRLGEEILPVIPKDIVFVQDSSASMAEQRLFFCRQALTNSLSKLGPNDRFNVVSFRDTASFCFSDWAVNNSAGREQATRFIMNMKSTGNTDLLESIKELKKLKREPGRPVIALLISDGRSNTGVTRSSDIIGEFSKLNNGEVSVFTIGTIRIANTYLLDLLSYCNRGSTAVVEGGRWGIPDAINRMVSEISRPVMCDMNFRFPEAAGCEVYPSLTSNLYLDRSFVLYGKYPRELERIVFQVLGKAQDMKCDMIFDLNLKDQKRSRDKSIRTEWAKNKIYSLIGQYVRKPDPQVLREIKTTSSQYNVEIPYQGKVETRE